MAFRNLHCIYNISVALSTSPQIGILYISNSMYCPLFLVIRSIYFLGRIIVHFVSEKLNPFCLHLPLLKHKLKSRLSSWSFSLPPFFLILLALPSLLCPALLHTIWFSLYVLQLRALYCIRYNHFFPPVNWSCLNLNFNSSWKSSQITPFTSNLDQAPKWHAPITCYAFP